MARILHVIAHMGGGAGRFLSGFTVGEQWRGTGDLHRILLLEKSEKRQFVSLCVSAGIPVLEDPEKERMERELREADIVVLHWWHHPRMASFLAELPPVPMRIVLWSLVNGCGYPVLPFELAKTVNKVLFATPYSFDNPNWTEEQRFWARRNAGLVYALGLPSFVAPPFYHKRKSGEFRIGYVGTLHPSKLYPGFIRLCRCVLEKVPHARFILVGDSDGGKLEQSARQAGIVDSLELVGYTDDVKSCLDSFDVFGYPLNSHHFGATENALLEAMANGLPAVAFRQGCEQYIIEDGKSGFLARNEDEYADRIAFLAENPEACVWMGKGAWERVIRSYDVEQNYARLRMIWTRVLSEPKREFDFKKVIGKRPYEWFLSCLGPDRETFLRSLDTTLMSTTTERRRVEDKIQHCQPILRGKTKSSIPNYYNSFPKDAALRYWNSLLYGGGE